MKASVLMFERKPLMSLLIGVMLCFSLWHFMLQQQQEEMFNHLPQFRLEVGNDSIMLFMPQTKKPIHVFHLLEDLPKNDLNQLIDLENFEFLINQRTCNNLDYMPKVLVILVHSAPNNFYKRRVIRETWGRKDPRGFTFFLIGAVNSTNLQEKIILENNEHKDIVQGNFQDSYRNMTYKHMMAFKWFVYNCPNAKYLLKTDDDIFVNSPLIYRYLESPPMKYEQFHQNRLLFCSEIKRAKVKRTFRSKWRVSYDEFLDSYFPSHCPGFSILYSADIVFQLYLQAQNLPYFWIDDVHITGNVASKLNIPIASTGNFFLSDKQQQDMLSGLLNPNERPFFFARPNLSEADIRNLWKVVQKFRNEDSKIQI